MTARIRRARAADLAGLTALEQWFPSDRIQRAAWRRFLQAPHARVWAAVQAGEVVANLVLLLPARTGIGRIYSVVVAPNARGQGLGERLIATAERESRAAGRTRIRLEVRADNRPARALYAKRGYRTLRELPAYYQDGGDGLRLEKTL